MGYLFESELRIEAEKLINILMISGIQGNIPQDGFRDYLVKISISVEQKNIGIINLYYSPNKKRFSIKTYEIKEKSIIPLIENMWTKHFLGKPFTTSASKEDRQVSLREHEAFVDGFFNGGSIEYRTLILKDGNIVFKDTSTVQETALLEMQQVGGELQAVYSAINWCKDQGIHLISIFYKYDGIKAWATGNWKTNKPATRDYASFIQNCGVQIHWSKISSLSENRWNKFLDQTVKQSSQCPRAISIKADLQIDSTLSQAQEFIKILQKEKIDSTVLGILNSQFVRISFQPQGQMDIYSTLRRTPEDPHLSNFSDSALKQKIMSLWKEFYQSKSLIPWPELTKAEMLLNELKHLYNILSPYRNSWFDFSEFAKTLKQACDSLGYSEEYGQIVTTDLDFSTLESIYLNIIETPKRKLLEGHLS